MTLETKIKNTFQHQATHVIYAALGTIASLQIYIAKTQQRQRGEQLKKYQTKNAVVGVNVFSMNAGTK